MSKKIFIVYGHHDIKKSFNASVRDTFIEEAKKLGHQIDLINLNEVYKFLLTPKNLRKKIKKMKINFTYLFDEKIININDIKVDDMLNENLRRDFNQILLKENNLQNKIYFKKLFNDAIRSYVG